LLLAVPDDDGELRYVGRVGSGFTEKETAQWLDRFEPLRREDPPVDDVPALDRRGAVWLEPVQVGEVAFGEWSPAGRLRHPRWRGWRPDKSPDDVVRESRGGAGRGGAPLAGPVRPGGVRGRQAPARAGDRTGRRG